MKNPILMNEDITHERFKTLPELQDYVDDQGVITIISINVVESTKGKHAISGYDLFYTPGSYVEN